MVAVVWWLTKRVLWNRVPPAQAAAASVAVQAAAVVMAAVPVVAVVAAAVVTAAVPVVAVAAAVVVTAVAVVAAAVINRIRLVV